MKLRFLLAFLATLVLLAPTRAQESVSAAPPTVSEILADLKATTPKAVFLILDVSDSMKQNDLSAKMNDVIHKVLEDSVSPGDRVTLFTFGPRFTQVFDETVATPAARRKLLDLVPHKPIPGEGTNIRQPHHEALKLARTYAEKDHLTPFLVLMTDSYNDPPKNTPDAYTEYKKYYTPGKLTVYPPTPENADYERLLRWSKDNAKTFGIGVGIQDSQRPAERFSVALKPGEEPTPEPTPTPQPPQPIAPESAPPYGLIAGIAALVVGTLVFVLRGGARPMPLRIAGGPAGAKEFDLRGRALVKLGGEGSLATLDAYPLPSFREVAATIKSASGQFVILPQPKTVARVFVNGLPLEKPTPLRYGDEVRITLPDGSGSGVGRDVRLKFSDPSKAF